MKVKRSAEKLTVQELEEEVNLRMQEPEDKETPYVVDAVVQVWCSISVSSMHFRNYFVFGILYMSQMLYAGQSDRQDVTFFSDF